MKNCLEYKGYLGSTDFDDDGPVFVGKLLFIRDVITYSAETAAGLVKAFHEAVDDYLETCEELGDTPDTPCKGTFNVRVGEKLHRDAAVVARNRGQTLNDFVNQALTNAVQNTEKGTVQHTHQHAVTVTVKGVSATHIATDKTPRTWEESGGQEITH